MREVKFLNKRGVVYLEVQFSLSNPSFGIDTLKNVDFDIGKRKEIHRCGNGGLVVNGGGYQNRKR